MNIYEKLAKIQQELKAPKGQWNDFAKYNYRNCEDILEAVKPLLDGCVLLLNDEIVQVGERIYVKATATLTNNKVDFLQNSAFAREPLAKKGMDESQITGAASSYARKYALNGLFCIDDTKDADATNDHKGEETPPQNQPKQQYSQQSDDLPWYNDFDEDRETMLGKIVSGEATAGQLLDHLRKNFKISREVKQKILDLGK